MRKIVFLSSMAFDANISLIKRLRKFFDVYFFTILDEKTRIGTIKLDKALTECSKIPQFKRFENFLDLSKSYAVRHKKRDILNKLEIDWKVFHFVNKLNPDVIFVDSTDINYCFVRLFRYQRIFSIIHDPFMHSGENTLSGRISHFMLNKFASRYILFNEKQLDEFSTYNKISKNKIISTFLSQYEYLTLFEEDDKFKFNNNNFKILFWGRIAKYKGIKYLLDAIDICNQKGIKDISVVIAGKGSFDFKIDDYKHLQNVHIINRFLETSELVSLLKQTDLVVCPYTDATQSGVIMSAYAFKKPVLATNVGGLPEMLCYGRLGKIVPPCDSQCLASSIIQLKENKYLLNEYIANIEKVYFNDGYRSWDAATIKIINGVKEFLDLYF